MINTKRKNSRKAGKFIVCVLFSLMKMECFYALDAKAIYNLNVIKYSTSAFSIDHICGPCAGKEGVPGTSSTITEFIFKPYKSVQDHSMFAFEKMLWRVMNSILKGDFRSTQPGTEPGVDFFKICKQSTSSSCTKGVH